MTLRSRRRLVARRYDARSASRPRAPTGPGRGRQRDGRDREDRARNDREHPLCDSCDRRNAPAAGAELVVVAPETARIAELARPPAIACGRAMSWCASRFRIQRRKWSGNKPRSTAPRRHWTTPVAQTRARDLFDRGVAARREVEDGNRAVSEAEAALAEARSSLVAAQAVAGRATVRATFDGIVAERLHNPGDLVEATASDQVLRVIDRVGSKSSLPCRSLMRHVSWSELCAPRGRTGRRPEIALKVLTRPVGVEAGTATAPVRLALGAEANLPDGNRCRWTSRLSNTRMWS